MHACKRAGDARDEINIRNEYNLSAQYGEGLKSRWRWKDSSQGGAGRIQVKVALEFVIDLEGAFPGKGYQVYVFKPYSM